MGIISSSYFAYGATDESSQAPQQQTTATTDAQQQQKQEQQNADAQKKKKRPKNMLPMLGDGHYNVGCADIMLAPTDDGAATPPAEEGCGIFARIFYPCNLEDDDNKPFLPWKPEAEYVEGLANYRGMSVRKMNFFLDWVLGDKRLPVQWHLPLVEGGDSNCRFPVVVFSHGISGNRFFYSTFCASLASHGFVVAAVEHRDGSACYTYSLERNEEGGSNNLERKPVEMKVLPHTEEEHAIRIEQVRQRMVETLRMLHLFEALNNGSAVDGAELLVGADFDWSQFKDRLNMAEAFSIGHSFGGPSALSACAVDKRFKACVMLDGWLFPFERRHYAAVDQPVLMLCASSWQWPINVKRLKHLQKQGGGVGKVMVTMSDIVHQTYSDFGLLVPGRLGRYFGLQGVLDPEYTGNAIMALTVAFLRDPAGSEPTIRAIIANHAQFMQEGTNIAQEVLDKIDVELEESGEEEERHIAEGGEVDAQEAM